MSDEYRPLPVPDMNALREAFPPTRRWTYLNHAASATLPVPVRQAMADYLAAHCEFDDCGGRYSRVSKELREALADLIQATPEEIAFVQNTSEGLNIAANALPLQPGDNVIFCDMEFPANVYPWMNLQRRGIEARCIPNDRGGLTVAALERHADARTRAVAVSSVEFLTGFRTDLAAVGAWCRAHDAYFVVDAIQSLGAAPMDVAAYQIDFLSCGGPKWLMAPAGQGFLYCRRERMDECLPPFAGNRSVVDREYYRDYHLTFAPDAGRFEVGTANVVGQVGLLAAVRLLTGVGIEAIARWTRYLTDRLIEDAQRRGYPVASNLAPQHRSAIVSFEVPERIGLDRAFQALIDARVIVSKRERYIRVSPHCYNTEDEIARVGEVIASLH
ncbi:MAG: aminotransferase class V-fold PLP-dependent enzyme [Anaerolineales bacterium]|nr:aminotransferase class V-fold PLP-dependent enzyme [Anaerolineales bacterium]